METRPDKLAIDSANNAACADIVRTHDIDRYYSSLFAPAAKRAALLALYAFNAEIAQVRARISEPLPGEVRLQWWRDVVSQDGARHGEGGEGEPEAGQGHPVVSVLEKVIRQHALPRSAFESMIDARVFDLYNDQMPTLNDLEGYAGETASAVIRLASLILADGEEPGATEEAGHGGVAYAITGLLRSFGFHAAQGRIYLPSDVMARHGVTPEAVLSGKAEPSLAPMLAELRAVARHHLLQMQATMRAMQKRIIPAFLPVSLCENYLALMEAADYDPFRSAIDRAPLGKLWTLWRAS